MIHKAQVLALAAGHDALEVNGLSGTIDGTVGEELGDEALVAVAIARPEGEVFI